MVMLDSRNITSTRPSKKLDDKWYGPFKVVKKVHASAYELEIPVTWRGIHNVVNESLLKPYHKPTGVLHQETYPRPPPEVINENLEYEVDEILDVKKQGNQ